MFTKKRLTEAYKRALIIPFNSDAKYVFFSDLHRGDDSVSDEFTRNQALFVHALNYYDQNGFTYVEVGDGDELWEHPKFKHIRAAHSDVFAALKKLYQEDRFILLYGNHNILLKKKHYIRKNYYKYHDEYEMEPEELFPDLEAHEALILKNARTNQEIFVVHGHQGDLLNDQLWPISMVGLRFFWRYFHVIGFRNPASPVKNMYKRHKIEKNFGKWIDENQKVLVCGHTHRLHFPKPGEAPYFNTGCCIHTKGITGIEIVGEEIQLINWRVETNEQGGLQVTRTVVKGPEKIELYKKLYASTTEI